MDQALQNYEQSHDLHALQVATGRCQVRLEAQGGEDYAGAEPPLALAAPSRIGGRRNIGRDLHRALNVGPWRAAR
jgi:hypothetical protein